jgi:hypothetical protein
MKNAIVMVTAIVLVILSAMRIAAASIPGGDTIASRRPAGVQIAQFAGTVSDQTMPIGMVRDVHGDATISRLDGDRLDGSPGLAIHQGDTIRTGVDSGLTVIFADDTELSLGEDGNLVVDQLDYDPEALAGEARFNILQGVFLFLSGQIARFGSDAMSVSIPSATIGIRGSQMVGSIIAGETRHHVTLLPDPDGQVGEVVVTNRAGTGVLNRPWATTWTIGGDRAPAAPAILSLRSLDALYPSLQRPVPELPGDAGPARSSREFFTDEDGADLADFTTASGRAAEISVPMVGIPYLKRNGRHGQASVHTYLKVRDSQDAKTVCQWMPRIRDVMLATLQRHPLRRGAVGGSSHGWERILKKDINSSMKSDLIVSIRMTPYAPGVVKTGCRKDERVRRRTHAKRRSYGVSSLPRRLPAGASAEAAFGR